MKKNILAALIAITAAMGLSACESYTSPNGVAGTALDALKKNDLKTWRKTLADVALDRYGNAQGMVEIQKELSPFIKVTSSNPELISRKTGNMGDSERTYRMDVWGQIANSPMPPVKLVATLNVRCEYAYVWVVIPGNGPGHIPPQRRLETQTTCKITNIAL